MGQASAHISVCICTYKRPQMLFDLLTHLRDQETEVLFTYSIVVVDNDCAKSASNAVDACRSETTPPIRYLCQPERNISLARNLALASADGEYAALIDDDEVPGSDWLLTLYKACEEHRADGVLGPVKPIFVTDPPTWVVKGRFYEKGGHRTGEVLKWQDTRTSNAFLKTSILGDRRNMFRPELGRGGEDKDFFKRLIDKGCVFVWCDEAPVFETIPPERCTRGFMLRRALLRGKVFLDYPSFGVVPMFKSLTAIPVYLLALPFSLFLGHHRFMLLSIRLAEHIGRFLALLGLDVVKQYYVIE